MERGILNRAQPTLVLVAFGVTFPILPTLMALLFWLAPAEANGRDCGVFDIGCHVQQRERMAKEFWDGVRKGDLDKAADALTEAFLNSPSCTQCSYAAKKIWPELTHRQRVRIISRGMLTFTSTGSPILTLFVAGKEAARQYRIRDRRLVPVASSKREVYSYSAEPDCIVERQGKIFAGFRNSPRLSRRGKRSIFPEVDLVPEDKINATARRICTEWNDPDRGARAIKRARIVFSFSTVVPGNREQVKYWFVGTR